MVAKKTPIYSQPHLRCMTSMVDSGPGKASLAPLPMGMLCSWKLREPGHAQQHIVMEVHQSTPPTYGLPETAHKSARAEKR
jgi:hypothetical protein